MAVNDSTPAETQAEKLYGHSAPPTRDAQSDAPDAATAAVIYDGHDETPPIRQAITNRQDDLATVLRMDAAAQRTLGREVAEAVTGAGIGLYSYGLFETVFNGVVDADLAALRGREPDEAREREQGEETLRELQALYGEEETPKLLERVQRALKTNAPKLGSLITRARVGNSSKVVHALVEWIRNEDLGRA